MAKAKNIDRYEIIWPEGFDDFLIELWCFRESHPVEKGGLGRYGHLKNAIDIKWNLPKRLEAQQRGQYYDPDKHDAFIWNEWTEMMMQGFCENREVMVAGPGASWKTTCMALYYLLFWLCSPHNTRVILTSTTGDGLRARIWKEVSHFYRAIVGVGNLVQSRTMIQFIKGDDGAGIFGIAVESDGNVEKAINKIIGRHNTNMGVGIDEMPTVTGAIVEACVNLETGAERFELKGIGNPDSHFDPHGKRSEPVDGWGSISVDSTTWMSRYGALVIHLDGRRSPRVGHDDKFPGLIRQADLEKTSAEHGDDSPQMWKQRYGFWCPEGTQKTILSESDIVKFRAKEKAIWVGGFKKAAGLDPAFEGEDRCILQPVHFGLIDMGGEPINAIEFQKPIPIKTKATSDHEKNPRHYQIVEQCKHICQEEGIEPRLFGLDSTGEGGGLAAIFAREWSTAINSIEFGGRASDRPISQLVQDTKVAPKKGFEEYLNRVTELWYQVRVLVRLGQIRGLHDEAAIEFCKRFYELRGNLLVVESKQIMKKRTGKSPDYADACAVAVVTVQENDSAFGRILKSTVANNDWKKIAARFDVRNRELMIS